MSSCCPRADGLVGTRTRDTRGCDKWLCVNESDQTASLDYEAGAASSANSQKTQSSRKEKWQPQLWRGSEPQSPGQTQKAGGNFKVRNQDPQTCIWTSLHTVQSGMEQIKGIIFLKEKSNLDQLFINYSSFRRSAGRNVSPILASQKAVYVLGNCIKKKNL